MSSKTRTILKGKFDTGDTPSAQDFADLIDSIPNIIDDIDPKKLITLLDVSFVSPNPIDGVVYAFQYNATTQTFIAVPIT